MDGSDKYRIQNPPAGNGKLKEAPDYADGWNNPFCEILGSSSNPLLFFGHLPGNFQALFIFFDVMVRHLAHLFPGLGAEMQSATKLFTDGIMSIASGKLKDMNAAT
jgi:hypothetical protein